MPSASILERRLVGSRSSAPSSYQRYTLYVLHVCTQLIGLHSLASRESANGHDCGFAVLPQIRMCCLRTAMRFHRGDETCGARSATYAPADRVTCRSYSRKGRHVKHELPIGLDVLQSTWQLGLVQRRFLEL
jgi:hypothetical protein